MGLGALLTLAGLGSADVLVRSAGQALLPWSPSLAAGPHVADLVMSSGEVTPGAMFACVTGSRSDGHDYAPEAVARGAVAVACERPVNVDVPQVIVPSVRRALGPMSAALWSFPATAMKVVGVTGTNGKTTTCSLLASVFGAGGWKTGVIGTLTGPRTTPEAPDLQRRLAGFREEGVLAVAMEVSSHALDQHRVDGTRFAAAVFTNLSQDHLDYHGTMEAYFQAKARLFTEVPVAVAVVNRADPWGARLVDYLARSKGGPERVVTYSPEEATELECRPRGSSFSWRGTRLELSLPGRFNLANALAAATVAEELGLEREAIAQGLATAASVRGRFELLDEGQPFAVVVDFAHTPGALGEALLAARELVAARNPGDDSPESPTWDGPRAGEHGGTGEVIVVFGAGGERDPGKRPLMGRVAGQLADTVIVTSDNPRSEPPLAIIEQVVSGVDRGRLLVEPDRWAAIARALGLARPGDVVLIAGKGHETGQDFGTRVEPFDDAAVARQILRGGLRDVRPGGGPE